MKRIAILLEGDKVIFIGRPSAMPVRFGNGNVEWSMEEAFSDGLPVDEATGDDLELYDKQPIKTVEHLIKKQPLASGAGCYACSCGWWSRVSDDGQMFGPDYVSVEEIKKEAGLHLMTVQKEKHPANF